MSVNWDDLSAETPSVNWDDLSPEPKQPKNTFTTSVANTLGSGVESKGRALEEFAQANDMPALQNLGAKARGYGKGVVENNPLPVNSLSDVVDKPWETVKQSVGNAAAFMPENIAAQGIGRAVGTGVGALATAAFPPAAPLIPILGTAGQFAGGAIDAALNTYGGIRDTQDKNNIDNKGQAVIGSLASGAVEQALGANRLIGDALLKKGAISTADRIAAGELIPEGVSRLGFTAKQLPKTMLRQGAEEGGEELIQSPIEQYTGGDDPTTNESLQQTALGGVMGAVGGSAMGGAAVPFTPRGPLTRAAANAPQPEQTELPQVDNTIPPVTPPVDNAQEQPISQEQATINNPATEQWKEELKLANIANSTEHDPRTVRIGDKDYSAHVFNVGRIRHGKDTFANSRQAFNELYAQQNPSSQEATQPTENINGDQESTSEKTTNANAETQRLLNERASENGAQPNLTTDTNDATQFETDTPTEPDTQGTGEATSRSDTVDEQTQAEEKPIEPFVATHIDDRDNREYMQVGDNQFISKPDYERGKLDRVFTNESNLLKPINNTGKDEPRINNAGSSDAGINTTDDASIVGEGSDKGSSIAPSGDGNTIPRNEDSLDGSPAESAYQGTATDAESDLGVSDVQDAEVPTKSKQAEFKPESALGEIPESGINVDTPQGETIEARQVQDVIPEQVSGQSISDASFSDTKLESQGKQSEQKTPKTKGQKKAKESATQGAVTSKLSREQSSALEKTYKNKDDQSKLEFKQMLEDMIVTNKGNNKPYQHLIDKLGAIKVIDKGDNADTDGVYSNPVSGHPENIDHLITRNLVPIVIKSSDEISRKLDSAQEIYSNASGKLAKAEYSYKQAKTSAVKRKAKSELDRLRDKEGIHRDSIDALRDETLPELQRLYKEAIKKYGEPKSNEDIKSQDNTTSKEALSGKEKVTPVAEITGDKINDKWTGFSKDSGSIGIPRSEMPQVKAEHRGALVNFLNAKDITHEQVDIPAKDLKPTQAEFSPAKVEKAKKYTGGDRSILVSSDNHVVDGHHQWLAKLENGENIKAIRLNAPIKSLIDQVKEFPSAVASGGATKPNQTESQVKQPWEMTREQAGIDFLRNKEANRLSEELRKAKSEDYFVPTGYKSKVQHVKDLKDKLLFAETAIGDDAARNADIVDHYASVRKALSENKPVPQEVLADYPDLHVKQDKEQSNPSMQGKTPKDTSKVDASSSEQVVKDNSANPLFSKEDIPYKDAERAYMGISHSPEKRAQQEQDGYVQHMQNVYDSVIKYAKTDEQKAIIDEAFTKYKEGYIKKTLAHLSAKSRVMSPMITGPANFPVARNNKANAAEHNRLNELLDWDKKGQERLKSIALNSRSQDEIINERQSQINKRIASSLSTIKGIDDDTVRGSSRPLFVSSITGTIKTLSNNGETNLVNGALDFIEDYQKNLAKPLIAPKNSIWLLRDKTNEAKEEAKRQQGIEILKTYDGAKVVNNHELDRVQILFDEKPSAEIRDVLKKTAFKWSPNNSAWQRQNTTNGIYAASKVLDGLFELKDSNSKSDDSEVKQSQSQSKTQNPHTKSSLIQSMRKVMDSKFYSGWLSAFEGTGKFEVISRDEALKISSKAGDAKGFYNSENDTSYIVFDNISQDSTDKELNGLLMHEVSSHALKLGLNDKSFQDLLKQFEKLKDTNPKVKAAFDRVPADTKEEHKLEEAISYLLESEPNHSLSQRVISLIRKALRAIGRALPIAQRAKWIKWANTLQQSDIISMATDALRSAPTSLLYDAVSSDKSIRLAQDNDTDKWQGSAYDYTDNGGDKTGTINTKLEVMVAQYANVDGKPSRAELQDAVDQYRLIEAKYFNKDGSHRDGAMLTSNGKSTNLAKEQWIQVRTDNFKKWFGDSKVVDENGEPLINDDGLFVNSTGQEKSATINTGTFKQSSDDIRFSIASDAKEFATQSDAWKNTARNFDKLSDSAKNNIYALATMRQLVDIGKTGLNSMVKYLDAHTAMNKVVEKIMQEGDTVTKKWEQLVPNSSIPFKDISAKKANKAMQVKLADTMHYATVYGQDPTKPYSGKQNDEEAKANHRYVSALYGNLNATAKEVFKLAADTHTSNMARVFAANRKQIENSDASREAKNKMLESLTNTMKESSKIYFPLSRFGDYWLYFDKDGIQYFNMFETEGELRTFKESNPDIDVVSEGKKFDTSKTLDGVSGEFIGNVNRLLEEISDPDERGQLQDAMYQLYLQSLPDISSRKHFIHRNKTPGYHEDALRGFAHKVFHDAKMIGRLENRPALEQHLLDMRKAINAAQNRNTRNKFVDRLELLHMMPDDVETPQDKEQALLDLNLEYVAKEPDANKRQKLIERDTKALEDRLAMADNIDKQHVKYTRILNELQASHDASMAPNTAGWATFINSIGFMNYLGFSASAAIVNTLQTPVVSLPYMASRYGFNKANKELGKAFKEFYSGKNSDNHLSMEGVLNERAKGIPAKLISGQNITEQERKALQEKQAFDEMHDRGILTRTRSMDLIGLGEEGVSYGSLRRKLMYASAYMFNRAEVLNREVTGMTAFRLAMSRPGATFNQAINYADEVINTTHGDYTSGNRARIMRGNVSRVVTQFKQYSQMMTYLWGRTALDAIGVSRKVAKGQALNDQDKEAVRLLKGMIIMQGATAGLMGLPIGGLMVAAQLLADGIDDDDDPIDVEAAIKSLIYNNVTDKFNLNDAIVRGPLTAWTGVDFQSRLNQSDMWFREPDRELEGQYGTNYLAETLGGPIVGIAQNILDGKKMIGEDHMMQGIEKLLPKAIKDPVTALRYHKEGARTLRHDLIEDINIAEAIAKAGGFNSADLSLKYDQNFIKSRIQRLYKTRYSHIMDMAATAKRDSDVKAFQEVKHDILEWNKTNPDMKITMGKVLASVKQRNKTSKKMEDGFLSDRRLKDKVKQFDFAE